MKTARKIKIAVVVLAVSVILGISANAAEVIVPVDGGAIIGNTYQLQLLQYNTDPNLSRQTLLGNIASFILQYVPISTNTIDEKNYAISVYCDDKIFSGIRFTYEIDDDLNLPRFTIYYMYKQLNSSGLILDITPYTVVSFYKQTNGTYTIDYANQDLFKFKILGGEEFNSPEIIVYLTSCCGMVYIKPEFDDQIFQEISDSQVQTNFVTLYLTQFPTVLLGAGYIFDIAGRCIFNSYFNIIVQMTIFGGMTILVIKLLNRQFGDSIKHNNKSTNNKSSKK